MDKRTIYFLLGNVASGKSTVIVIITDKYGNKYMCYPEDLNALQRVGLLKAMYRNPEKNQFVGQIAFTVSKVTRIVKALKQHKIPIIERSGYSDRYVFAEANKKYFTKVELEIYNYIFDELMEAFDLDAKSDKYNKKFIYLRVDPKICYARCKKRARVGEEVIDIRYLKKLDLLHENVLLPMLITNYGKDNILILDNNDDEFTDENLNKILAF